MEIFFLCNTYMQIINAIQIRTKLFPNAMADIGISDHSNSSKAVYERLCDEHIFNKVIYIESHEMYYEQNYFEDLKDVLDLTIGKSKKINKLINDIKEGYDYFFYFNCDLMLETIYERNLRHGKRMEFVRFEEGIVSYSYMKKVLGGRRTNIIYKIRKFLRKPTVHELTNTYYCCYPNLFPRNDGDNVVEIPKIQRDDRQLVDLLNRIFEYSDSDEYKVKYIYFGACDLQLAFSDKIDEFDMVVKLADIVGRENLIVKKHPRDRSTKFEQNGIRVMQSSNIPWEVVQLNNNFESQCFIATSSSSIFNPSALLGDNIESYLLFPILKGRDAKFDEHCEENIKKYILMMQKEGVCLNHRFISDINEICNKAIDYEKS